MYSYTTTNKKDDLAAKKNSIKFEEKTYNFDIKHTIIQQN